MRTGWLIIATGLLLQAGVCGCGRAADSSPEGGVPDDMSDRATPWQSGSRLRARVYDAGEGAELFVTWVDGQTQDDCSFVKAGDGSMRCLPTAVDTTDSYRWFSDAKCQHSVSPVVEITDAITGVHARPAIDEHEAPAVVRHVGYTPIVLFIGGALRRPRSKLFSSRAE